MNNLWRKLPECSGCESTLGRCTHGIRNGAIACCPDCEHYVRVVGPVYRPDYEAMAKRVTDATYALDDWTEAQVVDLMRVAVGLVEVGEEQTDHGPG